MLDRPETQLLGLRGLFLEASRSNDNEAARALAEQAVKRDPKLAWGVNALFDLQARAGEQAMQRLDQALLAWKRIFTPVQRHALLSNEARAAVTGDLASDLYAHYAMSPARPTR